MYDIRQFRPTLYILLAMGVSGFALAEQSPGLWVLAMSGMALNAWLVKTGRFVPLPRLISTAATFLAVTYIVLEVRANAAPPILTIGEFLVLLHLVKLFEQQANRDYAQLLVLSLLLMAAAAISTASLIFGLLLVAYLFVSLYCCLLFHLKVESDAAKALLGRAAEKINPASLRQDQRRLSASMRRLTGLVSVVSIAMAILVFLFFPRGGTEGFLGRRLFPPPEALTGFSDRVSMDQVARINKSDEIVARVQVTRGGQPWGGTVPLLLRGTTLDQYTGPGMDDRMGRVDPWQWRRNPSGDADEVTAPAGQSYQLIDPPPNSQQYVQDITLEPTRTNVVFAMAGVFEISPEWEFSGSYWRDDGVLESRNSLDESETQRYKVTSSGQLPRTAGDTDLANSWIDPRIADYARRPQVSGVDAQGRSLADLRGTADAPPDIDHRIAEAMELHLRNTFQYTLDLTSARDMIEGRDPMVAFLYDVKRGHCEYFAGAMTLMCRSLGIPARMVVGYRSDEFNAVGHFYTIRQSQAHAWVEVLTNRGWETFDPTSSNLAPMPQNSGLIAQIRGFFDFLQFKWGSAVVAYGQENRKNIMESMNLMMTQTAVNSSNSLSKLPDTLNHWAENIASPSRIGGIIILMIAAGVLIAGYYIWEKIRLRQRVSRIGLTGLPATERRRLARQLGFYDDLLKLLERRGIVQPEHWTPLEFSEHLAFLPHQAFRDIRRLTQLFYRIRFGHVELTPHRRRRIGNAITKLGRLINQLPTGLARP